MKADIDDSEADKQVKDIIALHSSCLSYGQQQEKQVEYWQAFLEYEHANEVLIGLGAGLLLLSVWRILNSSIKLIIWVLLAGLGFGSLSYGMQGRGEDLPGLAGEQLQQLSRLANTGQTDVLKVLCDRLDEAFE